MHSDLPLSRDKLKGSALIVILIILGVAAALLVGALTSNRQIERDKIAADVMSKAKEALIGYAATYRDSHPGEVFGYLPCPDTNNDGIADEPCGAQDVSVLGRLPWKTLGLPPLRDSAGECLWYAVSGSFKNNPKTTLLNWDTAGQLIVNDAGGVTLATGVAAVIFSPRGVIGGQDRTPAGTPECGGNTTVAAYLDGGDPIYAGTAPAAGATTTLTVATATSTANGTNNDQGLSITPDEIFRRIKQRSDFNGATPTGDVNNLLISVAACLNAQTTLPPPVTIDFTTMAESPGATVGGLTTGRISQKTPNSVDVLCSKASGSDTLAWRTAWNTSWWNKGSGTSFTGLNFNNNWQDNLLYAKCTSGQCLNVNGTACAAVLIFTGERASGVNRASKNVISNYLEGNFLSLFNSGAPTTFTGVPANFAIVNVSTAATADIAACINPSSATSGQKYPSFIQTAYTKSMINNTATEAISWNGADSGLNKLTFAWGSITATGGTISADNNSIGVSTGNKISLAAGEALTYVFNEPRHSIDVRLKKVGNNPRSFRLTAKGTDNNYYVIDVPSCTSSGTTFFGGMRFGTYDTATAAANPNPNSTIPTYPIPFPNADISIEYTEIKIEAMGTSIIQLDGFDSRGSYEGLQGANNAGVFSPNPVPSYEADSSLPHPYPQCFWDVMNYYCPRVKQPANCEDWSNFQTTYHYNTASRFGFEPISTSDSITQVRMDFFTNVYSFRNNQGSFSTKPYQTLNIGGYTYYIGSYNRTNNKNFTAELYTDQALTAQYNDRVPLDTPYWFTLTGTGFSAITKTATNTFTFTDAAANFTDPLVKLKIGAITYYLKNSSVNNTMFTADVYSDPQMTVAVTVAPPTGQAYTLTTMSN